MTSKSGLNTTFGASGSNTIFGTFGEPDSDPSPSTSVQTGVDPIIADWPDELYQKANDLLLEEIREINLKLFDTVLDIDYETIEGFIVSVSVTPATLTLQLKSHFSPQMLEVQPLFFMVPWTYPACSPVLVDDVPTEIRKGYVDHWAIARSNFKSSLQSLTEPKSLKEIAKLFDDCTLAVILKYAKHRLLNEVREINRQLVDTVVDILGEKVDPGVVEGTLVELMLGERLKSHFSQMLPNRPLHLLVPYDYPNSSPVLVDNISTETRVDDIWKHAWLSFGSTLGTLTEPKSLTTIAKTWDACARNFAAIYPKQETGSSVYPEQEPVSPVYPEQEARSQIYPEQVPGTIIPKLEPVSSIYTEQEAGSQIYPEQVPGTIIPKLEPVSSIYPEQEARSQIYPEQVPGTIIPKLEPVSPIYSQQVIGTEIPKVEPIDFDFSP